MGGGVEFQNGTFSSSEGFYPSLLLWHVPEGHGWDLLVVARGKNLVVARVYNPRYYYGKAQGHGRDRLVVARGKNQRYCYQLSSSEG